MASIRYVDLPDKDQATNIPTFSQSPVSTTQSEEITSAIKGTPGSVITGSGIPPEDYGNQPMMPSNSEPALMSEEYFNQAIFNGKPGSITNSSNPDRDRKYSTNHNNFDQLGTGSSKESWSQIKDELFPEIIGLPPHAYLGVVDSGNPKGRLQKLTYAAMPVVELQPCLPQFGSGADSGAGLQLFSLDPERGASKWKDIVRHAGFESEAESMTLPLKIAFLNETSLGEQWSSSFGETMFEGMVNKGSNTAQTVRMLTGTENMSDAVAQIGRALGGRGADIGNQLGGIIGTAEQGINRIFGSVGDAGTKLLTGSRVDFPTVWQGSSFEPSYNLTIRLYNPWADEKEAYHRFILAPLCMILALVVPISDSKWTYNFPLFCRARCAGLFHLPAAAVSSIRVIKGGDNNDVSWHQQPGTVDIQITLDSLFQTMVATDQNSEEVDEHDERPTLKRYFDSLRDWIDYKNPYDEVPIEEITSERTDANFIGTTPQTDILNFDSGSRVPAEALTISNTLSETFNGNLMADISENANIMSDVTDQIDDISNSVTRGFNNVMNVINESVSNFDIGGLGISNANGVIPEFSASGFSGAFDLESILNSPNPSERISGQVGFPGGISASAYLNQIFT